MPVSLAQCLGSLPDRQLRKVPDWPKINVASSLPDRQLRKRFMIYSIFTISSLPDRQLRNAKFNKLTSELYVHCRIGSLEIYDAIKDIFANVHCRIGSLEKKGS